VVQLLLQMPTKWNKLTWKKTEMFLLLLKKKSSQKFNYPKNTIFKIVDENGVEIDLLKLNRMETNPVKSMETKPITSIESIDNSKNYVEQLEFKGINNIFLKDK
jgi:hypothetical protein